ncbi:MAG: hypothetical protein NTX50_26865 [Candidatus Sumerlaeota bacterium]|nr:hypothetical protein [Candidatus Sumerlaeota bacterium]
MNTDIHSQARWMRWLFGLLLAAWFSFPLWVKGIDPRAYAAAIADTEGNREARNYSAAARLFGQFRVMMSDVLFVKTEQYLDRGIAYAPHIDTRAMQQAGAIVSEQGHEHAQTIIPSPENDWRGFIGDLEREVSPWQDPSKEHQHQPGDQLLPFYWLAVRANPNNVKAYRVGAFWLAQINEPNALDEALRFAQEGVGNNPRNFILHKNVADLLRKMGLYKEALDAIRTAIKLALKQRPPEGVKPPLWDEDQEEELESSARYCVALLEKLGRYKEALENLEYFNSFLETKATMAPTEERLRNILSGKIKPSDLPPLPFPDEMKGGHKHDHDGAPNEPDHGATPQAPETSPSLKF